jgi:hypothetical protein
MKNVITKALQDTVLSNKGINEVYFSESGEHYFQKHSVTVHKDDGKGNSIDSKIVDTLPGVKDSILKVKLPNGSIIDKKVHVIYSKINETISREDVLNATATTPRLSEKEEDEVLAKASEIYKSRGIIDFSKDKSTKK